jgi:hypothetical protein
LILAVLLTGGVMFYLYRRHWALKCFGEVCDLEADLIHVIRDRVQSRWQGNWDRLGDEPFRGRIDYRSLRSKAEREKARDILGIANFGHLVGIVDAGWEVLGFNELCNPEVADPKDVIVANLSYVGSCRACLAHVGKLDEMTGKAVGRGQMNERTLKTHLSKHLHGQVKTSLRIIRSRFHFEMSAATEDMPVLTPLKPGSERVRRPK